jgi:hypothetical protein
MTPHVYKIWRANAAAPNAPHDSIILDALGDNESRVRRAAEMAASSDTSRTSQVWPADYCVLDGDGRLWTIRVDLVTRPTCVAIAAMALPPMPPAVHVFWHGKVACEDVRLAGVPSSWPKDQLWMSLLEFADGSVPNGDRCEACWRRAPTLSKERP